MSHPPKPINTQKSLRAYQLLGFAVVLALLVGIGGWGALASINGAIIAPATVAVESYTKKVQHREGGIVSEIRVKEGDNVQRATSFSFSAMRRPRRTSPSSKDSWTR